MSEVTTHALYCTFWVAAGWFGVPGKDVREVHALPELTPIPGAPRTVAGYVNLRGQLYLVLKASEVLADVATGDDGAAARLVLFRASAGESFALLVDALGDMVEVADDRTDWARGTDDRIERAPLAIGRARLEEGMLTLIDSRRLLGAAFGDE
jgi:purine-binding chemotaxis protein CheW